MDIQDQDASTVGLWWKLSSWLTDSCLTESSHARESELWSLQAHHGGSILWPCGYLITSRSPHLPTPSHWMLGFNIWILGDTNIQAREKQNREGVSGGRTKTSWKRSHRFRKWLAVAMASHQVGLLGWACHGNSWKQGRSGPLHLSSGTSSSPERGQKGSLPFGGVRGYRDCESFTGSLMMSPSMVQLLPVEHGSTPTSLLCPSANKQTCDEHQLCLRLCTMSRTCKFPFSWSSHSSDVM